MSYRSPSSPRFVIQKPQHINQNEQLIRTPKSLFSMQEHCVFPVSSIPEESLFSDISCSRASPQKMMHRIEQSGKKISTNGERRQCGGRQNIV